MKSGDNSETLPDIFQSKRNETNNDYSTNELHHADVKLKKRVTTDPNDLET